MRRQRARGLTLFEVLVSATLLFLCITIAVMAFTAGSRNFNKGKESIDAYEECLRILDMIAAELREADPSPSSYSLGPTGESVTFTKWHNPTESEHRVTWRYNAAGRNVMRSYTDITLGTSDTMAFGERISRLSFSMTPIPGSSQILISVSISAKGKSETASVDEGRLVIDLSTKVYLRQRQEAEVNITFDRTVPDE